jgi:hypothetical protein
MSRRVQTGILHSVGRTSNCCQAEDHISADERRFWPSQATSDLRWTMPASSEESIIMLISTRYEVKCRDLCGNLNNLVRCDSRGFSTSFKQSVSHSEGKPQHLSRQVWLPWKLESHVTLVRDFLDMPVVQQHGLVRKRGACRSDVHSFKNWRRHK